MSKLKVLFCQTTKFQDVRPKSHKQFKEKIAEEVGVHPKVVEDFLTFYYAKVRKALSTLEYPRINVDGLGTFFIRKGKLENAIKRNKSMLGNLRKRTYEGYEKTYAINKKLEEMQSALEIINENIENKKEFKKNKNANK